MMIDRLPFASRTPFAIDEYHAMACARRMTCYFALSADNVHAIYLLAHSIKFGQLCLTNLVPKHLIRLDSLLLPQLLLNRQCSCLLLDQCLHRENYFGKKIPGSVSSLATGDLRGLERIDMLMAPAVTIRFADDANGLQRSRVMLTGCHMGDDSCVVGIHGTPRGRYLCL